jgi:hypothetical protein
MYVLNYTVSNCLYPFLHTVFSQTWLCQHSSIDRQNQKCAYIGFSHDLLTQTFRFKCPKYFIVAGVFHAMLGHLNSWYVAVHKVNSINYNIYIYKAQICTDFTRNNLFPNTQICNKYYVSIFIRLNFLHLLVEY